MSGEKKHKDQLQVVEGSVVGVVDVISKFDYNVDKTLRFIGEVKTGTSDVVNGHYIEKILYDNKLPIRVLIASNKVTAGSTRLDMRILSSNIVELTLINGDFTEANKGDGLNLTTALGQNLQGGIIDKKVSNTVVEVKHVSSGLVEELAMDINSLNLFIFLNNDKTKNKCNRRWDHRERYFYE